jgi:hypothetical protein
MPLGSEFKAGWGQNRSPDSEGCSAMAAVTTVVEPVPFARPRRRHRQSRKSRAAVFR